MNRFAYRVLPEQVQSWTIIEDPALFARAVDDGFKIRHGNEIWASKNELRSLTKHHNEMLGWERIEAKVRAN